MRIFLAILFISGQYVISQLQPGSAPGWVYNSGMSDEFNAGPYYDANKWNWNYGYGEVNASTCQEYGLSNISIQGGYVSLYIRDQESTCWSDGELVTKDYTSGNLIGLDLQQYGYFEVRMRVPAPPAFPYTHKGISANAWLFGMGVPANCVWDEIDLCEIDAWDNRHTCNRLWDPNECDSIYYGFPIYDSVPLPSLQGMRCDDPPGSCDNGFPIQDTIINSLWHTYGMVWYPNGIAFYMDGVLIKKTTLGCPANEPMCWILNPSTGEGQFDYGIQPNTLLPYHMDVDYVRTYNLNMDCNTVINTCSFNFLSHDNAVKKSITIGGSGCTNTMPSTGSGANVALRATDFIQINGDFTVPVGSQLSVEPIGCY